MSLSAHPPYTMLYPLAHLRGGGRFSYHDINVMTAIETLAQERLGPTVYFRDLFPAGPLASSGGSFPAYAAFADHPDDPSRPHYLMAEFKDVFRENLPSFLPKEDADARRALIQFLVKQLAQFAPIISKRPLLTSAFTHAVDKGAYVAAWALNTPAELRDAVQETLREARHVFRQPDRNIAIARDAAETVLHQIIGDRRLDQLGRNIIITSQKLGADNTIEDDHFAYIQPEFLLPDRIPTAFKIDGSRRAMDAVLATTAVPLVFTMDGDKHIDTSPFMQGQDMVAALKRCCTFGSHMGYVRFGNINGSLADTLPHGMRGVLTAISTAFLKKPACTTLMELVGQENVFLMETRLPTDFQGSRNFLDASPAEMDKLAAVSDILVQDDMPRIISLVDRLIWAYHARQAMKAPAMAVA